MKKSLPNWKEMSIGGIIKDAGNALEYETGDWRAKRPIWHEDRCIHCLRCWIFCPDSSIKVGDEQMRGIDYRYCKGCGLCSSVCPSKVRAIEMIPEKDA